MKGKMSPLRNHLKYITIPFVLSLLALVAAPMAWADGTPAGTTITNRARINYQVGGADQIAIDSEDEETGGATNFEVDRKVDLMVSNVPVAPDSYVEAPPNGANRVLTFTVRNDGNAPFYFHLAADNYGTDPFGGTENQDVTVIGTYVEASTPANSTYDDGVDTPGDILTLDADQAINVYVVCDIPDTATAGQVAAILLTATAREPNTGIALTNADEGTTWTRAEQTLFADGAGRGDNAEEADYSEAHAFRIFAANLTASKKVDVIADGVSTSDYKAIPGALVQYTITVSNTGATAASTVAIADPVPANVTLNGIFSATNTNASVTPELQYSSSAALPPAQPAAGEWAVWPPGDLTTVTWVRSTHSTIDATTGEATMVFEATID